MSRPYAWRPLGLLPILKASALTNNNAAWQRHRRLDLYHRCMDPVVAEINELCSQDRYFRFADRKVRVGRCFWHMLSMDGLEIAATTLCSADWLRKSVYWVTDIFILQDWQFISNDVADYASLSNKYKDFTCWTIISIFSIHGIF